MSLISPQRWLFELILTLVAVSLLSFVFLLFILSGQSWTVGDLAANAFGLFMGPLKAVIKISGDLLAGGTSGAKVHKEFFVFFALVFGLVFAPFGLFSVRPQRERAALWIIWGLLWAIISLALNAISYA